MSRIAGFGFGVLVALTGVAESAQATEQYRPHMIVFEANGLFVATSRTG